MAEEKDNQTDNILHLIIKAHKKDRLLEADKKEQQDEDDWLDKLKHFRIISEPFDAKDRASQLQNNSVNSKELLEMLDHVIRIYHQEEQDNPPLESTQIVNNDDNEKEKEEGQSDEKKYEAEGSSFTF